MEEEENTTPFWLQTTDRGGGRRRRGGQSSSPFFSAGFVVILLLLTAVAFIFFIIPSFLSYTSQVFSPHLVKKGWNSLNLVLVLFAVVCGFFSGNRDSESGAADDRNSFKFSSTPRYQRSNSTTPRQWYDYSDRDSFRGMRSSNSNPDLRLESQWTVDDDRWRFYDDTRVYGQSSSSNQIYQRRSWRELEEEEGFGSTKDIVDSVVNEAKPPPQSPPGPESPPARSAMFPSPPRPATPPSPPPPATEPVRPESPPTPPLSPPRPPPPKVVRRKQQRTYQDLAARNRIHGNDKPNFEIRDPEPQTLSHPPLPPPPPPTLFEKASKSEKKRGGANATKDFLNSLRRKKKKQRQKSVENLNFLFDPESISSTSPLYPPPSPPPPPPPPPPPAFFRNIFSPTRSTAKKFQSPVPPPPPPPRRPLETRASKVASYKAPLATRKPPLPVKMSSIYNTEENTDSGNESPLNPIPRPPPPPPFKTPAWKFVVHGDFVRLKSIRSSRLQDPDGVEDPSSGEPSPSFSQKSESEVGDLPAAMFCPSPDVDTKADNFIARFRAGLQLEKIDSVKRRSNLGPGLDPSPNPESLER